MVGPPAGRAAAALRAARRGPARRPPRPTCACDSWSSHSPITLRRNRVRAVDAALVGEVRRPAGRRDHRLVEFDADERPRPARDVGETVAGRGHADDRRGGVVRADRGRPASPAEPGRVGDVGAERPGTVPGCRSGGNSAGGMPSSSIRSRAHVADARRRAARSSRRSCAPSRIAPVSQYASRSGMSSIVAARRERAVARSAASW